MAARTGAVHLRSRFQAGCRAVERQLRVPIGGPAGDIFRMRIDFAGPHKPRPAVANPTHIPRVQHCGGRARRARGDPRAARPDSAATIRRMVDSGNDFPSPRSSRVGHGDFPVSASVTGSEKCRRYQRQTRSPFSTIPTTWRAGEFVANSGQFGTRRDRSNEFF